MTLPKCWYCELPLQRATQFVGVADVILGLLSGIVFAIDAKEKMENTSEGTLTFPPLAKFPLGLIVTFLVLHASQLLLGIVLFFSAVTKNRGICRMWLGVTGATALFTGLLFRIYEMLIVNDFSKELKRESEEQGDPGQEPNSNVNPITTANPPGYSVDLHQLNMTYSQPYSLSSGNEHSQYGYSTGGRFLPPPPLTFQSFLHFNARMPGWRHNPRNYDWKRWYLFTSWKQECN